MKDWSTKVDNAIDDTKDSYVNASDFNSLFNETKNVVKPFMALNENDDEQLVKSIGIMTKAMFYKDVGTVNNIHLVRSVTTERLETYVDGMMLFFTPKHTNTGDTTIYVNHLHGVPVTISSTELPPNYLNTDMIYMAIYDFRRDMFRIKPIVKSESGANQGNPNETFQVADGVEPKDAVNVEQLALKVRIVDIIDNLTSTDVSKPLSANQGRILYQLVDEAFEKVNSDDINLDTLQEVVDYIKTYKQQINPITIPLIDGLQSALDDLAIISHNHNERYYTKSEMVNRLYDKANYHGQTTMVFNVADGIAGDDLVNKRQLDLFTASGGWDYTETTNPLITTNPTKDNALWKNTTTGEFFVCIDKTVDANHWMGSNETEVKVAPVEPSHRIDIFSDNSAIGLFELNGDLIDTGGVVNSAERGHITFELTEQKIGSGCINIDNTGDGSGALTIDTPELNLITVTMWIKDIAGAGDPDYYIDTNRNQSSTRNFVYRDGGTYHTALQTMYRDGVEIHTDDVVITDTDNWHHYVFTFNEVQDKITVGAYGGNSGVSDSLECYIDQIRLFNRALTTDEINQLMNEQ